MPRRRDVRKVCFVTGTRAEYGLMRPVLDAVRAHPKLALQVVATGMHMSAAHGSTVRQIEADGFKVDARVGWEQDGTPAGVARATGEAVAGLASVFAKMKPDVVMVTGDRVEAFAGAAAAHISGVVVAHVHGGDRALGQVDDALRHAITKLAHVHFAATEQSAERIRRMGEDAWRVHRVGTPGVDGIRGAAWKLKDVEEALGRLGNKSLRRGKGKAGGSVRLTKGRYAVVAYHPTDADNAVESRRAVSVFGETAALPFEAVVVIFPNNDPGSTGIRNAWRMLRHGRDPRACWAENLPRRGFLGLMRDAAVLVGNSSAGIIEAASFGTPVVNVGDRQKGRERSENVTDVPFTKGAMRAALEAVWNEGNPRRANVTNVYGGSGAGRKIAGILGRVRLDEKLRRKLIAY